ncbi:MAG: MerR family transcriptional regulator [Yoonia sp.]|uniref:MerR family transcriptional regulator n=1 Tax=Yoonia sp. TaxID=2212373 RepID=UPI00273F353E|nr:MerR family transcriptional regulator [Yoonia sp.]MDP5084883.1 MerR family transcriptional regulator [Yoonia sp.]
MAKAQDAFRTISEVAEWLDTPTHVLRFWESKFSQIKPVKGAGGRRYYRPTDMDLLGGIKKLLHEDGLTIKGAQKLLREKGVKYVAGLGQSMTDTQQAPTTAPAPVVRIATPLPPQTTRPAAIEPDSPQGALPFDMEAPTGTPQFAIALPLPPKGLPDAKPRLIGRAPVDASVLHDRAAKIAPLLARLEVLRSRMQRST